jgi:curved DNA-binding protein CbpA
MSHYETLGVGKDATPEEIKVAYRKQAMLHHPDREGGSDEAFTAAGKAYELLSDPERRANYDKTGEDGAATPDAQEADRLIVALFDRYLMEQGSLIEHARAHLKAETVRAEASIREAQHTALKLRKKREKIKVQEGRTNVVHSLIDSRLEGLQRAIELASKFQRVSRIALSLVDSYQSSEDALEGFSFMTSTMRT